MALRTKLSPDYPEHTQPAAASLLGAAPTHSSTLELQTNIREVWSFIITKSPLLGPLVESVISWNIDVKLVRWCKSHKSFNNLCWAMWSLVKIKSKYMQPIARIGKVCIGSQLSGNGCQFADWIVIRSSKAEHRSLLCDGGWGELTMTVSTHQQNIKQCLAAFRKLVSGSGGEEEVRVGCCYSPDTTKVELCLTIPCSSSGDLGWALSCFPQNMIKITFAKPRQEFKSHCCPLMQTSQGFNVQKGFSKPKLFFPRR